MDSLLTNIRTIVARFCENAFRQDMTFARLTQLTKGKGDAAWSRIARITHDSSAAKTTGLFQPRILDPKGATAYSESDVRRAHPQFVRCKSSDAWNGTSRRVVRITRRRTSQLGCNVRPVVDCAIRQLTRIERLYVHVEKRALWWFGKEQCATPTELHHVKLALILHEDARTMIPVGWVDYLSSIIRLEIKNMGTSPLTAKGTSRHCHRFSRTMIGWQPTGRRAYPTRTIMSRSRLSKYDQSKLLPATGRRLSRLKMNNGALW